MEAPASKSQNVIQKFDEKYIFEKLLKGILYFNNNLVEKGVEIEYR